jgi:hypothetical protein
MNVRIFILTGLACFGALLMGHAAEYGVARVATPVLNTPDFTSVFGGKGGGVLKADRCGQVRELEYIALPGTVFTLLKNRSSEFSDVYQVTTEEYPAPPGVRLYVDGRFLQVNQAEPLQRRRSLPSRGEIISTLQGAVTAPYVWGGNVLQGVPELAAWFFQGVEVSEGTVQAGLDCSGLLYYATGGWTPRNTSRLIEYGQRVAISGKTSGEIARLLQPLDLIAWNGHVIIVLDRQTAIESRLECGRPGNGGVMMTDLSRRIAEVMRMRRPVDDWPKGKKGQDVFVVRRWFSQN